ncbi:hypothetical protein ACFL2P_01340 [Candidatus Moduliflexota bacterium]
MNAMRVLHHFLTRPAQLIGIGSCSLEQSQNVPFRMLKGVLLNTPFLRDLVRSGQIVISASKITFPSLGSEVWPMSASEATSYGIGFSLVWLTELAAAAPDGGLYAVMSAGTSDRKNAKILIDSTASGTSHVLHTLFEVSVSGSDPSLSFSYIAWRPGQKILSPLIDEKVLKSQELTFSPSKFKRDVCNQWGAAGNPYLTLEQIQGAIRPVPTYDELEGIYQFIYCAMGFDLSEGRGRDASYAVTIAKCLADEEDHIYVLRCTEVPTQESRERELQAVRSMLWQSYPDKICSESFNSQALTEFGRRHGYFIERVTPNRGNQHAAFSSLHHHFRQGTISIPPEMEILRKELEAFEVNEQTSPPTYGGSLKRKSGGPSDDCLYALAWSCFGVKDRTLSNRTETIWLP